MFVVTERVGAANSEGVQCSPPVLESPNDSYNVSFNSLEHPAPTELNRLVAVDAYKHCIPTGFFVQLNNLRKKTRILRLATQRNTRI